MKIKTVILAATLTMGIAGRAAALRTIYVERSSKPDMDWESLWATLTFEVP